MELVSSNAATRRALLALVARVRLHIANRLTGWNEVMITYRRHRVPCTRHPCRRLLQWMGG